ncbi:EAL domain-containing protein [uncultured Roseobacter sp.]|uniref:sensor domain-containing phosphodiesterase n=1 Tax=uncultured Roseobacter sp. TaxID=114847 RepID=UPI0026323DBD|nr:EAL domain-containing protein [uncultured Roseobacter sp.]
MTDTNDLIAAAMIEDDAGDVIQEALEFVRSHMDMEVAYLSEFVGDNLTFRRVSAPGLEEMIAVGDSMPLDQVYCPHILAGRLPELIPDTDQEPFAQTIPLTQALPIRSHVSIPIRKRDGSPYGMFCCLSREARPTLNGRDLDVMRAFATLSSETINSGLTEQAFKDELREKLTKVMDEAGFDIAYQPIMVGEARKPAGFEALCRFKSEPYRSPDLWFAEAHSVGLQAELEVCVIEKALQALEVLPPHLYLSVNASPETVAEGKLRDVFAKFAPERIVLEITEHSIIGNYDALLKEVERLRYIGVRIAIDDAGAGYAGLQHIVKLCADIIKLDMSLTSGIDQDVVKRSLASAMVGFAEETGAKIVAEGVETEGELGILLDLGVELIQGYLLGRPADLDSALALCQTSASARRRA